MSAPRRSPPQSPAVTVPPISPASPVSPVSPISSVQPDADDPLIEIGMLTRAHGLKGEVCVHYYAESLDLLRGPLWMQAGQKPPRPVRVASVRAHQSQVVIRLEGVADRTAAEHLRGIVLLIPESALPPLDDDSLYVYALIGLPVFLHESGEQLGTLMAVDMIGEQELWRIEGLDGREILFPAVPQFVAAIELGDTASPHAGTGTPAGYIRIAPPPGLLELYAPKI